MNGIVLLGSPGSGKSVVGKLLTKFMSDSVYVSSGDIARQLSKKDEEIKKQLGVGQMATEDKMRQAVMNTLYSINLHGKMFILDGFPRTREQLELLEEQFTNIKYIYVDVYEEECTARLIMRKRADDTSDNIERRLGFYKSTTLPFIETMKSFNKIDYTYDNNKIKEDHNFVIDVYNMLKQITEGEDVHHKFE